jgi:hypothetical protein
MFSRRQYIFVSTNRRLFNRTPLLNFNKREEEERGEKRVEEGKGKSRWIQRTATRNGFSLLSLTTIMWEILCKIIPKIKYKIGYFCEMGFFPSSLSFSSSLKKEEEEEEEEEEKEEGQWREEENNNNNNNNNNKEKKQKRDRSNE